LSPTITSLDERAARGSYVGCIAGALSKGEYEAGLEAAGFEQISVEFTHEVADGMHAAIVKAVKAPVSDLRALPVTHSDATSGCC
jgi:arsenite methyltransferase